MKEVKIYEYLLDKSVIIKVEHIAKIQGDRFKINAGKGKKTLKILRKEEFDKVVNNHVFSLEDNFAKYEHEIIRSIKNSYYETENKQIKKKVLLDTLEANATSVVGSMACIGCCCDTCYNACSACVECIRAEYGEEGWEDFYNDGSCDD